VQAAQILAIATSNHTNNVSNASLSNRKKHRNNFANIEGRRASIEELRQRATIKHKKDSHAYGERWIARCCGESIYQNKQYIQLWGEETGKKPQTWDLTARDGLTTVPGSGNTTNLALIKKYASGCNGIHFMYLLLNPQVFEWYAPFYHRLCINNTIRSVLKLSTERPFSWGLSSELLSLDQSTFIPFLGALKVR